MENITWAFSQKKTKEPLMIPHMISKETTYKIQIQIGEVPHPLPRYAWASNR